MNFAVPADHKVNMEKSENIDKYLDLAKQLKKQWNMKVTVISLTVRVLRTVFKGLKKCGGIRNLERIETIQTTALLKLASSEKSLRDV